ncbi:hypothetical protein HK101_005677 [Irineochytrium annulatum]|nr:hypothetical protein HK101_005677 [Irineochytrium annulatum]
MAMLDRFEGSEYTRELVTVSLEDGSKRSVFTYIWSSSRDVLDTAEWSYDEFQRRNVPTAIVRNEISLTRLVSLLTPSELWLVQTLLQDLRVTADPIVHLPVELILRLAGWLGSLRDLANLSMVSRAWNDLAVRSEVADAFWRQVAGAVGWHRGVGGEGGSRVVLRRNVGIRDSYLGVNITAKPECFLLFNFQGHHNRVMGCQFVDIDKSGSESLVADQRDTSKDAYDICSTYGTFSRQITTHHLLTGARLPNQPQPGIATSAILSLAIDPDPNSRDLVVGCLDGSIFVTPWSSGAPGLPQRGATLLAMVQQKVSAIRIRGDTLAIGTGFGSVHVWTRSATGWTAHRTSDVGDMFVNDPLRSVDVTEGEMPVRVVAASSRYVALFEDDDEGAVAMGDKDGATGLKLKCWSRNWDAGGGIHQVAFSGFVAGTGMRRERFVVSVENGKVVIREVEGLAQRRVMSFKGAHGAGPAGMGNESMRLAVDGRGMVAVADARGNVTVMTLLCNDKVTGQ